MIDRALLVTKEPGPGRVVPSVSHAWLWFAPHPDDASLCGRPRKCVADGR